MGAQRKHLHVASADDEVVELEPEVVLPDLFASEAVLMRQLAAVRQSISHQGVRFAAKEKLLMLPSYHALKRQFAPTPSPPVQP